MHTPTFEPLEPRRLLSTVAWTNRGPGDGFDAVFGTQADAARAVVDRAAADWGRVVVDLNHAGGGNTLPVAISAGPLASAGRRDAVAITGVDAAGRPTSAAVTLDDDGGGRGWYVDPVPGSADVPDDGEFVVALDRFAANRVAGTAADLYRSAMNALGHAVGLSADPRLAIASRLAPTGVPDPLAPGTTLLNYAPATPGGPAATFTTAEGDLHLFEGFNGYSPPAGSGVVQSRNDLMQGDRRTIASIRHLASDLDAALLADAYGYAVEPPSRVNTFLANLNTATGQLNIDVVSNGTADAVALSNDAGGRLVVEVNGTREAFPAGLATFVLVNPRDGSDAVTLGQRATGAVYLVQLGEGDDAATVSIAPGGGAADVVSVSGGPGADALRVTDGGAVVDVDLGISAGTSATGDRVEVDGAGAVARLAANQVWSSLSATDGGRIDLQGHALALDYAAGAASPLASVAAAVRAGAIFSDAPAPGGSSGKAIGYGEASAVGLAGRPFAADLSQASPIVPDGSAVLIRPTLLGDADLNGRVDALDARRYGIGRSKPTPFWTDGDFDGDGDADGVDLGLLAANFGASYAGVQALLVAPAPAVTVRRAAVVVAR